MTDNQTDSGSPPRGRWLALGCIATAWVASLVGVFVLLPGLLLAAYDGESFGWLNEKIAAHAALAEVEGLPTRDRQWYADSAERYSYRLAMFATVAAGLAVAGVYHRSVRKVVAGYLNEPDYALNLGVARAVAFSMLLSDLLSLPIREVAAMPSELYKWPFLTRLALAPVPVEPWYVDVALPAAMVACVLAILGVLSRWSAPVAVVLCYTLVGIPTLTGKVNHEHHVLIIAALIALSRCGDGFSIDSALRGSSRRPTQPSRVYGFPLRLAWLVLATVYFFPGFWKAAVGPDWVFGGAMTNITRNIWFQRETFEPLVRVDLLGPLGAGGALATIVFELGFLFAVFFKWPRVAFAVVGMGFHIMVKLTMGISFYSLMAMYALFVDWRWLLTRIGVVSSAPSDPVLSEPDRSSASPAWSSVPATIAFCVAFAGFLGTGFAKRVAAWPVACYPAFDSVGSPYTDWPLFVATTRSGRTYELDDDPIRAHYGAARYVQVLRPFVAKSDSREALVNRLGELASLWQASGEIDPEDPPESVEVFVGRYELTGPKRPAEPMTKTPRLTATWEEVAGASAERASAESR